MSKVICIAGESGSGKTTSMRNLEPRSPPIISMLIKKVFLGKAGESSTTRRIKIILRVMMRVWFVSISSGLQKLVRVSR